MISGKTLQSGYANSASNIEILQQPLTFFKILLKTTMLKGNEYLLQMFGSRMGALSIEMNGLLVIVFFVFVVGLVINEKRRQKEGIQDIWGIGLTTACIVITTVLVYAAEYVQWTEVGKSIVDGIQGRYFLPFLFPLLFIVTGTKRTEAIESVNYHEICGFIGLHICFLIQLFMSYLI